MAAPKGPHRLDPKLPAHARTTFAAELHDDIHFEPATCEQVDCSKRRNGFTVVVDETSELGQRQAYFLRFQMTGRRFTEERRAVGTTLFEFAAGNDCFADHRRRVDRPPLYVVRGGDWRGNPRGERRVHRDVDEWGEHLHDHTEQIARAAR